MALLQCSWMSSTDSSPITHTMWTGSLCLDPAQKAGVGLYMLHPSLTIS